MTRPIDALLVVALLGGALPAYADDEAKPTNVRRDGWYAAPMVGYMIADPERFTHNGFGFAPMLGHRNDDIGIELGLVYTRLGTGNTPVDALLTGGVIDLMLGPFERPDYLSDLYGVVGFGALRRQDHPRFPHNDTSTIGDAGLGALVPVNMFGLDWGLRAEARYRFDVQHLPVPAGVPRSFRDWIFNIGLQIPLSPPPPPPPAPEPVAVVPPVPPPPPPPEPKCEPAQPGQPVTLEGCKAGDTVVLNGVTFATNKAELDPDATTILDSAAAALNKHVELKVEVGGHTDSVGSDQHNQKLSERRAKAVRDYLIGKGVAADRLTAAGYGESKPIDNNDTDEGRARNRRVELKLLGEEATKPEAAPASPVPSEAPISTPANAEAPAAAPSSETPQP